MILFVIIMIAIILIAYIIKNKIIVRFETFLRKGFTKNDDRYGVYCFTGKQGDGKTYSMVDMLTYTGKNKVKICNIKTLCERSENYCNGIEHIDMFLMNKKEHDFYVYETDFNKIQKYLEEIENTRDYIIIYDEIFTLIEKGKLSKESLSFLSQMRKRGLYLYTTAQEWLEINITFRRYVRFQVACKMINIPLFNFAISINEINDAYQMTWDNEQNEYVAPRVKTTIKKCGLNIANSYDTFEVIKTEGKMIIR